MIFRIQYEISTSLSSVFDVIKQFGDFIFTNKTIYVSTELNKKDILSGLKSTINEEDQIMVLEITPNNVVNENNHIRSWASKMWRQDQIKEFEQKNQEQLEQSNKLLALLEIELEKQLKNKKVGVGGGSKKATKVKKGR